MRAQVRAQDADPHGVHFDGRTNQWLAPFAMARINTRVVRRSAGVLRYGDAFAYQEYQAAPTEAAALRIAKNASVSAETLATLVGRGRLPAPGDGPPADVRAASRFKMVFIADADGGRHSCSTVVSGGDGGYDETAKMVSESALMLLTEVRWKQREPIAHETGGDVPATTWPCCVTRVPARVGLACSSLRACASLVLYSLRLALQRDRLAHQGGVLTPATAFGTTLATRLSEHGLRFETSIFDGPYIPPPPAV